MAAVGGQTNTWTLCLGGLLLPLLFLGTAAVDQTGTMVGVILGILMGAGAAAAVAIYFSKKRKKEVQEPKRCLLGQEVTLHCSMEGMFPEDVAVMWERIHSDDRMLPESAGDQKSPEHRPLSPALPEGWRVTEERAGTCLTSYLTFTPTVQDDGAQVRCVFLHEAKGIREERVSPEIRVWARPQVSEIRVLPEWDPRDKVPFAVQMQSFYPKEVPPIQWGWDGDGSWREDPARIDKKADGTFTATSVWRVPSQSLTRPDLRVQVCVQRGPGEPPSKRELSLRDAGLLRPPEVSEISQPKSMAKRKGVTLSCHITGHFPGELSVTWLRRGKGEAAAVILQGSAEWRVEPGTAVLARDGKSFQQDTRLTLLTSMNQGAEYICRVGHLALETPIERSTDLGEVSRLQALVPGQPMNAQHLLSRSYPRSFGVPQSHQELRREGAAEDRGNVTSAASLPHPGDSRMLPRAELWMGCRAQGLAHD
ncbi:hypothetical protein Y1Q_0012937 [Alligator mississippiensis]|uniref:Ig-like domain-containing protein n=1 Tax=Alligator mississippiensis TaxID=8496 RepID=A0A151MYT7_ALLMI|nr:hypothetical protein Y1Q_0012937 [Alligator mississippiensis]